MEKYLTKGSIPDVFDRSCNLLRNMENEKRRAAAKYLNAIITELRESTGTEECFDTWMLNFGFAGTAMLEEHYPWPLLGDMKIRDQISEGGFGISGVNGYKIVPGTRLLNGEIIVS